MISFMYISFMYDKPKEFHFKTYDKLLKNKENILKIAKKKLHHFVERKINTDYSRFLI